MSVLIEEAPASYACMHAAVEDPEEHGLWFYHYLTCSGPVRPGWEAFCSLVCPWPLYLFSRSADDCSDSMTAACTMSPYRIRRCLWWLTLFACAALGVHMQSCKGIPDPVS